MAEERYIRFDWAIKRLLRHKADFVVVEGFLTSLLGEPLKIVEVLESEGNRQTADDKTNRVDVLVKDTKGRKIIIEIQNYFEDDYFHRMLYGASKVVTEHIKRGDAYGGIGKVYSVNIVFFKLGQGEDYVYQGKTDFRGIHRHDVLLLTKEQQRVFEVGPGAGDVFPEYFVLRVEDFDAVAKTPLDEWIHFLKTEEIPSGFSAPGLAEARERLQESKLTSTERTAYERHYKDLRIRNSEIETAFRHGTSFGEKRGEKRGVKQGLKQAALAMLADGMPSETVAKYTGLPAKAVKALSKNRR